MKPVYERHLSTWIVALLRNFFSFGPSVASWECNHCGLTISARGEDGTLSSGWIITLQPASLSPCSHYVEVTREGKLSILCAWSDCDGRRSVDRSGAADGTSCLPKSSDENPNPHDY